MAVEEDRVRGQCDMGNGDSAGDAEVVRMNCHPRRVVFVVANQWREMSVCVERVEVVGVGV